MAESPARPLVVVADDEADITELLEIVLERGGFEVQTAVEGDAALELIRERQPVVCVLDGTMPGLAGFEVLEAMRADGALAGIPVVILTATVDEEREIRRFGVEPEAFMKKPFDAGRLLAEVARLSAV